MIAISKEIQEKLTGNGQHTLHDKSQGTNTTKLHVGAHQNSNQSQFSTYSSFLEYKHNRREKWRIEL